MFVTVDCPACVTQQIQTWVWDSRCYVAREDAVPQRISDVTVRKRGEATCLHRYPTRLAVAISLLVLGLSSEIYVQSLL
ncbi:hypothetical protein J6590_002815 [Homalodisca vitripennis]|nr:hypothetical protein J6590_002815 [Homalodisca vitripennis]